MKTVILVRHAKSSWSDSSLSDRDRPLNKRGKRDAPMMGGRLAARDLRPDRMITSPATRARLTALAFADALDFDEDQMVIDDRIYHGGVEDIWEIIREQSDGLRRVMIFGHNPDLTDFVNGLGCEFILNVPTCGVVELRFDADSWSEVGHGCPVDMDFDYPKKGRE
jgi:phosphohistidine phosphatase